MASWRGWLCGPRGWAVRTSTAWSRSLLRPRWQQGQFSGQGHVGQGAGHSGLPNEEIPAHILHQSREPVPPQQTMLPG